MNKQESQEYIREFFREETSLKLVFSPGDEWGDEREFIVHVTLLREPSRWYMFEIYIGVGPDGGYPMIDFEGEYFPLSKETLWKYLFEAALNMVGDPGIPGLS